MANCHNLFTEFNSRIQLTDARKTSLKKSRKKLRDRIRTYFNDEKPNEIKPKFKSQGSFLMDTGVNPIPRTEIIDGEEKPILKYDIDDGVYFIGGESKDKRKTIQTYHDWIWEAVKDHTDKEPIDKNTCIRVLFADGHNIDLPIYYKKGDIPELAHKAKGWIESDPKAFADWFNQKASDNPQLRKIVRYLKAWCDFRKFSRTDKPMPSGFIMTILATEQFYGHERDDVALKETLIKIEDALQKKFQCLRPTAPTGENLLENYTAHKDYFMSCLSDFIKNAKSALEEKTQTKACKNWCDSFGDRFPCSLAKDVEEEEASAGLAAIAVKSTKYYDN